MTVTAQVLPVGWLESDNPPALNGYRWRLLAEGDSWFALTAINPASSSNFLYEMAFSSSAAIVSCARQGDELRQMVDKISDFSFYRQFVRRQLARTWDGVLISASGNDLIAAVGVSPLDPKTGQLRPVGDRLLLTAQEVANPADPDSFVSEAGWRRLTTYLQGCYQTLLDWRASSPSAGRPIFTHTYAVPVARPAGALPWEKGWLYPALLTYGVPGPMMQPVTRTLFARLRAFLLSLDCQSGPAESALPRFHVFDSSAVVLTPAPEGSKGSKGDWINEIHLSKSGYRKVAPAFSAFIEEKLGFY
jgi:hypothetical protein